MQVLSAWKLYGGANEVDAMSLHGLHNDVHVIYNVLVCSGEVVKCCQSCIELLCEFGHVVEHPRLHFGTTLVTAGECAIKFILKRAY